jgi:hypothetical protein
VEDVDRAAEVRAEAGMVQGRRRIARSSWLWG